MGTERKLAVVTGASRGIGLELARVFARNGYDLVINASDDELREAAADLRNLGGDVTSVVADLSTKEGVDNLWIKLKALQRPVDVVCLNAGVGTGGLFVENDFNRELEAMNLNVVYLVYLAKLTLKDMVARNDGKILFTSSIAAEMPSPYNAVYAATKSFVQSFAEAVRGELKETGKNVTITALQPGPTDTGFFEKAQMENTKVGKDKKDDPADVAQQGFDALMRGDDHVVAGSFKNKAMAGAARFMTEEQKARVHGNLSKPEDLQH